MRQRLDLRAKYAVLAEERADVERQQEALRGPRDAAANLFGRGLPVAVATRPSP